MRDARKRVAMMREFAARDDMPFADFDFHDACLML